MATTREKGSQRVRNLSPRQQFNYYKKQLQRRLISEQAFTEARVGYAISPLPYTTFKNLDYEKVYNEGITRKVGNTTVRYTGEEAVKLQIESMRARASKQVMKRVYIRNYVKGIEKAGFTDDEVEFIEQQLSALSADKLTYLIQDGSLPSIYMTYDEDLDKKEFFEQFIAAIKGLPSSVVRETRHKARLLEPLIKARIDITGVGKL